MHLLRPCPKGPIRGAALAATERRSANAMKAQTARLDYSFAKQCGHDANGLSGAWNVKGAQRRPAINFHPRGKLGNGNLTSGRCVGRDALFARLSGLRLSLARRLLVVLDVVSVQVPFFRSVHSKGGCTFTAGARRGRVGTVQGDPSNEHNI